MRSDLIDVVCKIMIDRPNAILVSDGTKQVWLPKSQVEIYENESKFASITMPEWLAIEKGLI